MAVSLTGLVAHAGPGASWQAVVSIVCLGLGVVLLLAVAGFFDLREPGDLLLPIAAVVIIAGVGTGVSEVVSDWVGWAIPVGAVSLTALLIASSTDRELGWRSPLFLGSVVLGAILTLVLVGPLTEALHPPEDALDSAPLEPAEGP